MFSPPGRGVGLASTPPGAGGPQPGEACPAGGGSGAASLCAQAQGLGPPWRPPLFLLTSSEGEEEEEGALREPGSLVSEQGGEFLYFSVSRFPSAGDYLCHLLPV